MDDTIGQRPDHSCLFAAASEQHGYFTTAQAQACGFTRSLVAKHARTSRFIRIRRGLYRLRDYPSYYREEVVAAWLAVGKDVAVVSHDSALDLFELSNVSPDRIHLTVPRSKRHLPDLPGVAIHTTTRPFGPLDLATLDGIRLTSPARTIFDAAEAGTAPNQIEMAIHQAVDQGLATPDQLAQGAHERSKRVKQLVAGALIRMP